MSEPDDVVMQPRCLYCGVEHYGPAVDAISRGAESCESCGRVPPVFHDAAAYRAARRETTSFREAPRSDPNRDVLGDLQASMRRTQDEDGDNYDS